MRFTINKDILVKELAKTQGVGEKRQTMIILSNVLVTAENNMVSLLATNMEVGVLTKFDADVSEDGKITVSAKNIYDIAKELPQGPIEIESEDSILKVKAGKVEFKIPTLPASDFPKVPLPNKTPNLELKTEKLKVMMDKIIFCASSDETKYHLNSLYIDKAESSKSFRMVSTDGHRMAMIESDLCSFADIGSEKGILIPKKGASEFRKLLDGCENVSLLLDSNYLYIFAGNTVLFIKEMDLEYPDYTRVIPKQSDKTFKLKRKDLLSALKRVSLVSTIKSKTVLVTLNDNSLLLSSRSPDFGEATEELEVDYNFDQTEIRFNSRYLIDILSAVEEEILSFESGDPLSPVLIRPSENDKNYLYVVMPMRL